MGTPKFPHHCDDCKHFATTSKGDFYVCGTRNRTVLFRYGPVCDQYQSTDISMGPIQHPLLIGAVANGLVLTPEETASMVRHAMTRATDNPITCKAVWSYLDDTVMSLYDVLNPTIQGAH
jgi:hypothetical protein